MKKTLSADFPSFSEGLSLREVGAQSPRPLFDYFPSFSEGLSLRGVDFVQLVVDVGGISLPSRRDFH